MNASYAEIKENSSDFKRLIKDCRGYIIINIIFTIIGMINIDLYSTSINIVRISLLWIFIYSIGHSIFLENKKFFNLMNVSSIGLVILGGLSIVKVRENVFQFLILNFIIINLTNFIYFKNNEKKIIKKYDLIIFYMISIVVYSLCIVHTNQILTNNIFMITNLGSSLYNVSLSKKEENKKMKHYEMIKNLSLISLIGNIVGVIYVLHASNYSLTHIYLLKGVIYLILFNYTYYSYQYCIKNIIKNPYCELLNINEELDNKSKQLNKINDAIKNEIEICNKIKKYINQRHELLNQSLDAIPNIWIITDYEFNILYTNKKCKSIFNEDIKNFFDLIKDIKDYTQIREEIIFNKSKECIADKIIYLNEDVYTLNINNNLSDNTYLICLNNITKEIKLEQELEDIKEEYEYIIENIPCAIMIRTSSDIIEEIDILGINKSFAKLFGYSKEELEGMNLQDYYKTFNIEFLNGKHYNKLNLTIEEKIKNIQDNAKNYNLITATMEDKEFTNKNMEITVDDYIEDGNIQKILILKDMTEEINTYKGVNRQNQIYRQVLNSVPEGIIIESTNNKKIIYTNKKFREIFDINGDRGRIERLSTKYRDRLDTKFLYNLHVGEEDKTICIVNESKKIKEIKIATKTWYMGEERFTVKLIEDLGQQREAERIKEILIRQREYDKLKMEFYANMSHELKTPLNNIYSSTQLVENLYNKNKIKDKNNEITNHIKIIKQNMLRLVRLIDNIINISQVKSEIYKIKSVNFDIVYLIEEIVSSVQPYASAKDLNLIFDTNEEVLLIGLDPETIERIVLNLLSNAIKFTRSEGEILVGVYKVENKVRIIVKDSGVGIDEGKLTDIFDRFKQIEDGGVSNEFGSGIGLYLSKSLVEVQDGSIDIKSRINEGTEIIVEFPIRMVKEEEETIVEYSSNIEKFKIEFFDIYK